MATDYRDQLRLILQELRLTAPVTGARLEALSTLYPSATVFYTAFVVLCLQVHVDRYGVESLRILTHKELLGYLPYETMRSGVWELINDVVQCYCSELNVDGSAMLSE